MSSGMRAASQLAMRNIARNTGAAAASAARFSAAPPVAFDRGAASSPSSGAEYHPPSSGRFLSSLSTIDPPPPPPPPPADAASRLEYRPVPKDDLGEFQEYSVIFTNRSLNLMSKPFQQVMRDLNELLKATYNAHKVAIIPG
jgi:hypothetical protein